MSVYRWTAITSGTMTDASERRAFIARADVYGRPIRINWSDDGTAALVRDYMTMFHHYSMSLPHHL